MAYEINVTKNHKHYFATSLRSINDEEKAREIYELFLKKFPKEEGYNISVSMKEMVGKEINFDNSLN